jgi:hypothetical protein
MEKKNKVENPELQGFKNATLWLLSYKLFRDYFDAVRLRQCPEPEQFFTEWVRQGLSDYNKEEQDIIWELFIKLLVARAGATK